MSNDDKSFIVRRRLKEGSDGIELSIRCPRRASGQTLASCLQLQLAEVVGRIDVVKLVSGTGGFDETTESTALSRRIAREIENHRDAPVQEINDEGRHGFSHAVGTLDEVGDDSNLARV